MKLQFYFCFLLLNIFVACDSQSTETTFAVKNNTTVLEYTADTVSLNSHYFIQTYQNGNFNCLLSIEGDTIIASQNYYSNIAYLDIDEDGCDDIRVFIFSNMPNDCITYLFDKKSESFKLLQNCHLDIKKIEKTSLFYSYNAAGCADMDWESHLSKINNFKLFPIGYIRGQGCDFDTINNPQTIEIYKILQPNDIEMKIEELPYLENIPQFEDKWDFIENYWSKNYELFQN